MLAQSLEVPIVVAHLPFRFKALVGRWFASSARDFLLNLPIPRRIPYSRFLSNGLAELESGTGVTIAVENMPARWLLGMKINGYEFNSPAELSRFPHLTLDTRHLGTWGMNLVSVYAQLRDRVAHVHLSNVDGAGGKRPREHRSPPDGNLPLADLLCTLARDGYQGAITVETGPEVMRADDEERCLMELRRALGFCREHFK
jgi:sugar phosphate isomerase/epimerase